MALNAGAFVRDEYDPETISYSYPSISSKKGATSGRYNGGRTVLKRVNNKPAKAGTAIGFYDPEIAAILGVEI
jgi:hypothetical protein